MSPKQQSPKQKRFTFRQIGALVAVFIIVGLVGATLAIPSNGSNTSSSTSSTLAVSTTTTAPTTTTTALDPSKLPAKSKELYDLVLRGRAGSYYVRFQLSGASLPSSANAAFLEIWRSGPNLRQDTRLEEAKGVTLGANLGGPTGTVTCRAQAGIPLACQQDSTEPFDTDADFLQSIIERLGGADVVTLDDTVAGSAVTCYVLDGQIADKRAEACMTPDGVPLVVEVPGLRAQALESTTTVDAASFTPPAPVSGPSESTTLSTTINTTVTPSSSGG